MRHGITGKLFTMGVFTTSIKALECCSESQGISRALWSRQCLCMISPSSRPAKAPAHAVGTHSNTQVISLVFPALFMVMSNYSPQWGLIGS